MILAKPWKLEAVGRLIGSVFVCLYGGALAGCLVRFWQVGGASKGRIFYPLAAVSASFLGAALVLLRRPMGFENLPRRLGAVLGCLYAGLVAGLWVQKQVETDLPPISQVVVAMLCVYASGLFLLGRFVRQHQMSWDEAFGFGIRPGEALVAGLLAAALFLPVGWFCQQAGVWVCIHFAPPALKPEEQRAVQVLRTAISWGQRGILGVITVLLAPIAEELFFRGILYAAIKQAGFQRWALWGTAVLFAFVHLNLVTFLPLMILGLLLAFLYERSNNLLAPIAAHSLFNAVNFAMLYLQTGR